MVKPTSLTEQLALMLGTGAVAPASKKQTFLIDGVAPEMAVIKPASTEEVVRTLRFAHEHGLAVVPWGGGTQISLGNQLKRYDLALSLERLNRVLEHEPADLTVTVEAGIRLSQLQENLAAAGQFLPLDSRDGRSTIGGLLASNASGPLRSAYGSARDWTIGLKVVTADGRIAKAGGKVVKNVAGYDLCKLYIGSLGSLAVIVEASFKVAPLPKAQATLVLGIDQADIACALSYEVRQRGLSLQAAELLNARAAEAAGLSARSSYSLYLLFGGTVSAVQRSLSTARELAQEAGMSVKERPAATGSLLPDQPGLRMRINVLPTDLPELVSRLDDPTSEAVLAARPLVGSILACWPGQDADLEIIQKVRELVSRHGGTFLVEQCSPAVKAAIDVFNEAGPSFELMRRIKQQFDPTGVLSPGRFSGRL